MSELLRVDNLSRHFGGFAAVSGLSLHVDEGEIVGLVGPNGAGKTTTFNLVSGFLKPSVGHINFRGRDVTGMAPQALARQGLVRTFQHTRVFAAHSVWDNVRLASHMSERGGLRRTLFGAPRDEVVASEAKLERLLEFVELGQRARIPAGELSYGEQRVLEITIALAAEPVLLLLDEPFAGMNDAESQRAMRLIHRVREAGTTILVIDHHMDAMARGCDRLVVMDHGVKIAEGPPEAVTRDPEVITAYLGAGAELAPPTALPQTDGEALLALEGVNVAYGPVQALSDVSLRVARGEFVALIGANGAGKTTALRAVSGLVPVTAGRIRMRGNELGTLSPSQRVRSGLAHCPEGREIFPRMTVLENLELGAIREPPSDERYAEVYRLFPVLSERSRQLAGSLSGGEQQMLAIGRALMSNPELLLLDEPSLGLAPVLAREVGEALAQLNAEGTSVLLVEQNAALALALAHRGYVLENGRVVLEGPADALRNDTTVQRAYLGA